MKKLVLAFMMGAAAMAANAQVNYKVQTACHPQDVKHYDTELFEECCGYACMNWYKEWYLKQNTTGIKQLETQISTFPASSARTFILLTIDKTPFKNV